MAETIKIQQIKKISFDGKNKRKISIYGAGYVNPSGEEVAEGCVCIEENCKGMFIELPFDDFYKAAELILEHFKNE